MSTAESSSKLLSELKKLDIRLSVDDGNLKFNAPKGVLVPKLIERIREHKTDIIRLLEERAEQHGQEEQQQEQHKEKDEQWDETPIPCQPRTKALPLSYAQQRFWFLDQLDQGNSATFVMPPIVLRFEGDLNTSALQEALNEVVQRHEVLRSAFRIEDDLPVQIALSNVELSLVRTDLSDLSITEKEQHIEEVVHEQALKPFDLKNGEILMRALLLKLADNEHVFILTMHHIIGDGWSMGILIEELSQLYRTYNTSPLNNAKPIQQNLLPLAIQYADYAAWERKHITGARLANHRDYWLSQLNDAPEFLPLTTDHPRPKVRSNQGSAVYFNLGSHCARQLSKLCTEAGVTPFMALLAAFGVLLNRYTGENDIVIGSPIAVRPHSQTEPLIGLFLNTLAMRIDLIANPDFNSLLKRVRKIALQGYEHKEMPFDQVLQALDLERNTGYTPLFQVLFTLQNAPMGDVNLDGLKISSQPTQSLHSPFDLVLSLEESAEDLQGFLRYNTDLFEHSTIVRMVEHFRILLEGLLEAPTTNITCLPMLTKLEKAQLAKWSGGQSLFKTEKTLAQKFTQQVLAHPNSIAVSFGENELTYNQLNERANQLAHRLCKEGVSKGEYVGLCTARSIELVIGILGILKAGAAYVPLDPSYPEERLDYMAENSQLQLVVTYQSNPKLAVTMIDLADSSLTDESRDGPEVQVSIDDVAYVIYTSGSTGRPKGVEVTHANVMRLFSCSDALFGFGSNDVWSLFHSYAFDFSVWELWGGLLYGGQVVVVPLDIARSPEQFHQFIQEKGVTVLNQTPSAFRQLIDADRRLQQYQKRLALKWVVFGGEALDPCTLHDWVERYGLDTPQLINMYGITETTVHVSYYRLTQKDIETGGSIIGQPLPDLSVKLVDQYDQLVPIGVAGEMLIGGGGVAKGYLNSPELTAERFIVGSSTSKSESIVSAALVSEGMERLYRSGDLARWRDDGCLEYLGRIDHQVKIRGYRIELGEIERCLSRHSEVSEAVVLTTEEDYSTQIKGTRLVAYVVSSNWQQESLPSVLRSYLQSQLPDYMMPAAMLILEQLPLTANGKLDKKNLDSLFIQSRRDTKTTTALSSPPETALEKLLASLWCEVLDVEKINIDDNFFELGGDSIRGAILANKIQQRLESIVYVVAIFEAPTIRLLISYLRQHYPEAMAKMGEGKISKNDVASIDEESITAFKALIPPVSAVTKTSTVKKNPRAIFVLSPPRSGSTLLRVLLGGHSSLFSPPELELLGFDTLAQRKEVCSGRDAFWLEGTLRAVMEACDVGAEEAKEIMASREKEDMSIQSFYAELQSWLGDRILVDKSPSYALDKGIMQRAEAYFDEPLYIHLHRHPYGMINSFEEAKLNQIFFRYSHNLSVRQLAELIWLQSHRNILEFLSDIPDERQINVSFEEITQNPEAIVKQLCEFIDINYSEDMLDIHNQNKNKNKQKQARMTDGIHQESKMLGDIKFHTHKKIDAAIGERWRQVYTQAFLGEPSLEMAKLFGYNTKINIDNLPIPVITRQGSSLPLSFAQQRLWFLEQLEGAGQAYNMPVSLLIKGPLNADAMANSLQAIVQRHETLRSHFETINGEPRVRVVDAIPSMLTVDLSHYESIPKEQALQQQIDQNAKTVFDLATGPLFRSTLVKLSKNEHVVLVNMHHIVSDGWSMGIIIDEWSQLYNAFVAKEPSPLAPLLIQYGDYAYWQHEQLKNGKLQHQFNYWHERLESAPALLELPTDRPRPAVQQFQGDTFKLLLDASLSNQLKQYAEQSGVSLYMLLIAAYAVLLMRYSGQQDIVIGSPTANRSRSELEPLVGFFVNTIVMRLDASPEKSFADFLKHVREKALEAYTHQDVSFEQLVEELKPQRNLSYSPLFQVMFSMQNTPKSVPELTDLKVSEIGSEQVVSKYDLTLAITELDETLEACFEYNTDLFDGETINRFANHYTNLLQSLLTGSEQSLDCLKILNNDDIDCLVNRWNQTSKTINHSVTIHGLFEAQVQRTPDAIAVKFGVDSLTYIELNERADLLANQLMTLGLTEGCLVGVCLPRSLDMIVALLAVLKTGSAYVPLDPNYPAHRIQDVLDDADVSLLLTESELTFNAIDLKCPVFFIDDQQRNTTILLTNTEDKAHEPGLAYVIYTSGSTGKPKGVMITHRSAVNFLSSMANMPGIATKDTLLAVTTIAFDIAVLELYLPLSVGAKVIIADEIMVRDGESLQQTIATEKVTIMQATPATWRLLLASNWQGEQNLKVLCGGEALPSSLAQQLLTCVDSLWNLYGPTETTVWSTIQKVTQEDLIHATLPIGKPIANTRIYILDKNLSLQPIGVSGQLFIGGEGLARAYLNRAELTENSFIDDPFLPGEKIYRTGDIARYMADGSIEYLGRNDQQIKIRGYRVEPGEVEHCLVNQEGVEICAVVVDSSNSENTRLLAYYVGEETDHSQLKQSLQQVLPDYMIPSLFIQLDKMPLTANGKVDRRALSQPEISQLELSKFEIEQAEANEEYIGSRDSIELGLVSIWEEVLGVKPIGIRDNFFDLGGHSIIAVRLMAKISQKFGRQLPLASLFQGSTIEALAQLLRLDNDETIWSSVVPITSREEGVPFYCAAGAGGNLVYFNELARSMSGSHPFIGLQPLGLDGKTTPFKTVEDLATHHLNEIERQQLDLPSIVAGHSFGGLVAFEMCVQLQKQGHPPPTLVLIDTPAPHFFQPTGDDWSDSKWLAQVSDIISHLYGVEAMISVEKFETLDSESQLALLNSRLISTGVLPEQNDVSFLRGFIEVYKANLCACYSPEKLKINMRVLLLRSQEQQPEYLTTEQFANVRASDDLGWHTYLKQAVTVKDVPGDHLTMMRSPNAEILSKLIVDFIST